MALTRGLKSRIYKVADGLVFVIKITNCSSSSDRRPENPVRGWLAKNSVSGRIEMDFDYIE